MKKILITGKNGLLGTALKKISNEYKKKFSFVFVGREDCDLMDLQQIRNLLKKHKPDYIIHTAASVGGINLNLTQPSEQFFNNLIMNTFLLDESKKNGVKKFINFSSVCAFPKNLEVLEENKLQDGEPFPAHFAYGYAKRISDIQIEIYRRTSNLQYCSLIPVNIFGENDNYNLEKGHVIPSLIHKCFLSKKNNLPLEIWGDGTPKREFIFSEDLAKISLELLKKNKLPQRLIASNCEEFSISQIVDKITFFFDYYNVEYSIEKPNGQLRRQTNNSQLKKNLKNFKFSDFDLSLKKSIDWFVKHYPDVRLK